MSADLDSLFNPSSIAIVGASHEPLKVGHLVAKNILDQGFQGELYLINPHGGTILNKKVYASLSEVGRPIDLAILAVPSQIAMQLLEEVHALGIKSVVIYAAGFKETDEAGKVREKELYLKAKEYGLAVLGPNCLGFINTTKSINATFLKGSAPKGNISVVSQSGALGSVLIDYLADHNNYGLSYFISLGNKAVLDESDCLEFLATDEKTSVIGMYLEDVKNGPRFREVLSKVTKHKPVIILKSGTSAEGSKAALSHTGGLVGDAQVYDAAFKQSGAVHAASYEQFLQLLQLYSFSRIPSSPEVLILSNAGGVGVLLTDELVKHQLQMVTITEHAKEQISKSMTHDGIKRITVRNPIDLLGDASAFDYHQAIESSIKQRDIGAVVVLLTPQANTEIAETAKVIIQAQSQFKKPIYPVFMGSQSTASAHRLFEKNQMVSFQSYEAIPGIIQKVLEAEANLSSEASKHSPDCLAALAEESEIKDILDLAEGKPFLNAAQSMSLLDFAGVPTVPLHYVRHAEELTHVVRKLHFPVVAKVASDTITHKTDVKGVITGVDELSELQTAFRKLSKIAHHDGCYVQEMVSGTELFLGVKRDSTFGPVVVYGIGGIYVELIKEFNQFIYPFSLEQLENGLKNTKLQRLLEGFRGSSPVNIKELHSLGMKLGFLLQHFEKIKAIDINPLFATEKRLSVADSRVVLA